MKTWWIGGAVALAGLMALQPGAAEAQGRKAVVPGPEWRRDFETARAEALKAGKPMLVVFRCQP